ncbi:hypothetical protein [Legionella cincinnatiensis]|uniref:hypothetical protein n=1 Tax=Legionella cincinnatiensis TaxID=28085 RepID=UPI001040F13A|nr:hypothetical protein [Legionella cincinnatiensis]
MPISRDYSPSSEEMSLLLQRIIERMARLLERAGYLERGLEGGLILDGFEEDVINFLQEKFD